MDIRVDDKVIRTLGGPFGPAMQLLVTDVTEDLVVCGPWTFDRKTGAEVDDVIGWGPPPKHTGSFITPLTPSAVIRD